MKNKQKTKNTGYVKLRITTHFTKVEEKELEPLASYGGDLDEWVDQKIAKRIASRKPKSTVTPKWLRPSCGAKTRTGKQCRALAVWDRENDRPKNGRCRMHGGLSTGPKTEAGKDRALRNLKQNSINVL